MRQYKATACFLIVLLLAGLTLPAGSALAQQGTDGPADAGVLSADLFFFREDQKLTLPKCSVSYWFVVSRGISLIGPCVLTLHLTRSPALIAALSSMTVQVNGTPVATRGIADQNEEELSWTIDFDPALIKREGYNEIKMTTVQRSLEGDCSDIDNPANWVVLHKDSALQLRFRPAANPTLAEYFALYYDTFAEPFTLGSDFLLSNPADPGVMQAMLGLANSAGMHYPDKELVRFHVSGGGEVPAGGNHKIFIETRAQPGAWSRSLVNPPQSAAGKDNAYLSIHGASAEYPFYKLLLSGHNEDGLKKATLFFSNRSLVEQAETDSLLLHSDPRAEDVRSGLTLKESGRYSFADFGYTDITLAGTFHQRANLSFTQPKGLRGAAGSYLDIRLRHSAALLSDRSLLNVYVNNTPLGSVKLSPANVEAGSLKVQIPEKALQEPIIQVAIEIYHYLGPVDCTKDYDDIAWTVIDAEDSKIFFKENSSALRPTLGGFPNFFAAGDGPAAVLLALPESPERDLLETASALAARTGQNTGRAFQWQVTHGEISTDMAGDMVILTDKNAAVLPPQVAGQLAVAPGDGGYAIQDNTLPIIAETLSGKTVIQVIRSPWDFYRNIYVILYDGREGLAALSQLLDERTKLNQLEGQLCVVGQETRVQSFTLSPRSADENQVPMTFADYVKQLEAFSGLPLWIIALILLAVAILVIVMIRIGRARHDEYRRTGEAHKREQGFSAESDEEAGQSGDEGENS